MTQKVLVTAGAAGIGLAIARAFAADGAKVHITDVSSATAVDALVDDVVRELGGLPVAWKMRRKRAR